MDPTKLSFLIQILGADGAKALCKAADRNIEIESVLVPRAILAWLGLVGRSDYEGDLPGVSNTYLSFTKSEEAYTGSVTIGSDVYNFDRAPLMHLAASVAVAIGVDADKFDPGLRDLDLARLGKSIDLLVKARHVAAQIAAGEELMKAISLIPPGPEIREPRAAEAKTYDYSHVLPPHHQRGGFKLQVRHHPASGTVIAKVYKGPMEIGSVKGVHENGALNIEDAEVNEGHQGKGFGTALYEGLMAHAHHSGIKTVAGAVHSTMASGLHQKLSRKHGMEYKKIPTPFPALAAATPGPYDNRQGPYSYAIKDEIPASTTKAEGPGPAHAPTAQTPPEGGEQPTMQAQKGPPKSKRPVQPPGAAKLPKTLKLSLKQSEAKCGLCGLGSFRNGVFRGCMCFRSLEKATNTILIPGGYRLEFGTSWDQEAVLTLMETLGLK